MNRQSALRCCLIIVAAMPGSLVGQPPSLAAVDLALRTESDPRKLADLIWSTIHVRCGDSYFSSEESDDDALLVEYKKPTFSLAAEKLSPTDELNGVQWIGGATMRFVASRSISLGYDKQPRGWTEWMPDDSPFHVGFRMTRKNGRWSVPQLYTNNALISGKMSCAEATSKEPFARYKFPTREAYRRSSDQLEKMKWDDFYRR